MVHADDNQLAETMPLQLPLITLQAISLTFGNFFI